VTVPFIEMMYTERGELYCVLSEHACAEDPLHHAPAVMATAQILDLTIIDAEKTEKWHKLQVDRFVLNHQRPKVIWT
jgi:hypothetical protein